MIVAGEHQVDGLAVAADPLGRNTGRFTVTDVPGLGADGRRPSSFAGNRKSLPLF